MYCSTLKNNCWRLFLSHSYLRISVDYIWLILGCIKLMELPAKAIENLCCAVQYNLQSNGRLYRKKCVKNSQVD